MHSMSVDKIILWTADFDDDDCVMRGGGGGAAAEEVEDGEEEVDCNVTWWLLQAYTRLTHS